MLLDADAVDERYKKMIQEKDQVPNKIMGNNIIICPQCNKYQLIIRETYSICTKCGYVKDYYSEEDIISCDIKDCSWNENQCCINGSILYYLKPNSRICRGYKIMLEEGISYDFKNQEELEYFLKINPDTQHVIMDENCLRLRGFYQCTNGSIKIAFIQIKEEDEASFIFKPSVDGGVVVIDKNQTELFESEISNG
jgi:hypothetical protein